MFKIFFRNIKVCGKLRQLTPVDSSEKLLNQGKIFTIYLLFINGARSCPDITGEIHHQGDCYQSVLEESLSTQFEYRRVPSYNQRYQCTNENFGYW